MLPLVAGSCRYSRLSGRVAAFDYCGHRRSDFLEPVVSIKAGTTSRPLSQIINAVRWFPNTSVRRHGARRERNTTEDFGEARRSNQRETLACWEGH
jgi:hypothetical protein